MTTIKVKTHRYENGEEFTVEQRVHRFFTVYGRKFAILRHPLYGFGICVDAGSGVIIPNSFFRDKNGATPKTARDLEQIASAWLEKNGRAILWDSVPQINQ